MNVRAEEDVRRRVVRDARPIVAAVDGSAASHTAVAQAVAFAAVLDAPILFVYVRRGLPGFVGAPFYQRRLTDQMARARRALDDALLVADAAGVSAGGEILEGSPRRRISEFAHERGARAIVVGSRERRLRRSVSKAIARTAGRPVIIARGLGRPVVVQ
jgi:nucleotide-binding universal stress UspA family protein